MATLTTVYDFFLPVIGGDIDTWGGFHNDNFEKLDDLLSGVQAIAPNLVGWKVGGVAVTSDAAELNKLDGVTLTTAQINALGGAPVQSLASLLGTADNFPYLSALNTYSLASITAAGRAILDDADAAAQRTTLGAQAALGFTPVEQGGGTNMGTSKVRIGWSTDAAPGVLVQVDSTPIGRLARATEPPAGLNDNIVAPGSPPLYACRAWVNFNGTGSPAIRAAGNVSSITDNGTGSYTVNFTTAMSDANFAVSAAVLHGDRDGYVSIDSQAAGSVGVTTRTSGAFRDSGTISVAVFR